MTEWEPAMHLRYVMRPEEFKPGLGRNVPILQQQWRKVTHESLHGEDVTRINLEWRDVATAHEGG